MTTLSEALAPRSDQLNADDLIPGPRVLKITGGRVSSEGREKKIVLSYEGDNGKPWKPCKTMGRAMVMLWSLTDEGFAEQVKDKQVRVYRDPEVRFGDQGEVGGIRISHVSHISKATSIKLTVSQGKKAVFTFHPLVTGAAPEGLTIDQARTDIESAADLDELKTVWTRKSMQPHRETLQNDLDARKAALATEGPTDDQRGDHHDDDTVKSKIQITANDIIARAKNATTPDAIDNLAGVLEQHRAAMTDDMVLDCEVAISDARGRVS